MSESPYLGPAIFTSYAILGCSVLYIYDYLLTLSDEVSAIWPSKFTGAKFIFLLNRYSFLLYCLISIFGQGYLSNAQLDGGPTIQPISQSANACSVTSFITLGLSTGASIATDAALLLRAIALYKDNRILTRSLIVLGLIVAGIDIVGVPGDILSPDSLAVGRGATMSCNAIQYSDHIFFVMVVAIRRLFDMSIFSLIVYKTKRLVFMSRNLKIQRSIAYVLLRDGALYYIVLLIMGAVIIVLGFMTIQGSHNQSIIRFSDQEVYSFLIAVNQTIPVVLINRMILNLRQYVSHPAGTDSFALNSFHVRTSRTLPDAEYAQNAILGNLGAPLRPFEEDEDIYDDDDSDEGGYQATAGERVMWPRRVTSRPEI